MVTVSVPAVAGFRLAVVALIVSSPTVPPPFPAVDIPSLTFTVVAFNLSPVPFVLPIKLIFSLILMVWL